MVAHTLDELIAYQRARTFKLAVYALVQDFPPAGADRRYRAQLMDAAASVEANVTEGWARFARGEIRQFLRYALGSLAEARGHVVDGTDRGYFSMEDCRPALAAADECRAVILGWWRSLERRKG